MKIQSLTKLAALAGILIWAGSGAAQASTVSGSLWHVDEAVSQNAIPANVPSTTPDVVFDVDFPLAFHAENATVGTWLASGNAFNIVENTANTLTSLMDNGTRGTFLEFTGSVTITNGQTFAVAHDDGLTLIIGGIEVISDPGPTSPTINWATYTGPSGTFDFQLVYGECCGGPAVLVIAAVPEPEIYAMMGVGLALMGWVGRRRKPQAA